MNKATFALNKNSYLIETYGFCDPTFWKTAALLFDKIYYCSVFNIEPKGYKPRIIYSDEYIPESIKNKKAGQIYLISIFLFEK